MRKSDGQKVAITCEGEILITLLRKRDEHPSQCSFAGKVLPVINNLDNFIRNFQLAKPIRLSIIIKDCMDP